MPLAFADFNLTLAVCELRYDSAYLLFDRTGRICEETCSHYTDCTVISALPNQTIFKSAEGSFAVELAKCSFTTRTSLERFPGDCSAFFKIVIANLELKAFTRVGFRIMLKKDFKTLAEAQAALNSLKLTSLPQTKRFGIATEPVEVLLRWQDEQLGTTWRLKAENGKIDIVLPPELEAEKPEIHKTFNGLVLDIDYYTAAPVGVPQWDVDWIRNAQRIVKRDTDTILGN